MLCNGLNIADNGCFTFQTTIDIAGVRCDISDEVCVNHNNYSQKKLTNKYTKNFGTFN